MLFMTGSKSNGSGGLLREVACPVCTVHLQVRNTYKYYLPFVTSLGWLFTSCTDLQVQVPTSGSETIECGVCQHPFLISAD